MPVGLHKAYNVEEGLGSSAANGNGPGLLSPRSRAAKLETALAITFWERCGCKPCCNKVSDDEFAGFVDAIAPTTYLNDEQVVTGRHNGSWGDLGELVERPETEIDAGAMYKGQWQGTQFHGKGRLSLQDGSIYEGYFVKGRAHGYGKFVAQNGDIYEGEWDRDRAHGRGKYFHGDGSQYDGEWCQDEKCGTGTEMYSDGSCYIGQFLHGSKHGQGTYKSPTGEVTFKGQMEHDKMHGDGTYHFSDGRIYQGQWSQGQMSGDGEMRWPDGSVYRGGMRKDLRQGVGMLRWPDGRMYKGQWVDGKQEGSGVIVDVTGAEMAGTWKSGTLQLDAVDGLPQQGFPPAQPAAVANALAPSPPEESLVPAHEKKNPPKTVAPSMALVQDGI
eukprot:TRINITY_DN90989_c0_g1_i1.p1 TRINITY_DN90989_c0_g1~~TRINITY_DN90989_c0_g1_i1.p1  ORF type:complete len:386 (-),score=69.09 TRINITY_DN90989_c0_g1_i1:132-1289(-)